MSARSPLGPPRIFQIVSLVVLYLDLRWDSPCHYSNRDRERWSNPKNPAHHLMLSALALGTEIMVVRYTPSAQKKVPRLYMRGSQYCPRLWQRQTGIFCHPPQIECITTDWSDSLFDLKFTHQCIFTVGNKNTRQNWCGASQCGAESNVFNLVNLILRLLCGTCLHMTSDDDQTRPEHTTQIHSKHHHHGGGSARPSSNMDLMNQDDWMCGRPGGGVG